MLPICQTKEIGIRPGEKLHEIMVTLEDSPTTYEYEKHFIVYPQVVWNNKQKIASAGKKVADGFTYSSDNNSEWLTVAQLREKVEGLL
jgi:FlaA1/EpsC-like NDP-sugar epimerase